MSQDTVIYHNPRCSKSRQTLALLEDRWLKPTIVEYLKGGLDTTTLNRIVDLLGADASVLLRTKEDAYAASGLDDKSTREQIIAAIVEAPILLERPIVVRAQRAALGRPPENVLSIL